MVPHAVVRWGARRRIVAALAIPVCAVIAVWAFVSTDRPSVPAGAAMVLFTAGAVFFQVYLARFRIEATGDGLFIRDLGPRRRIGFDEVDKVECIAQARHNGAIVRWPTTPEQAFFIVIHTKRGRVTAHRWMLGVDDLVASLRAASVMPQQGAPPGATTEKKPLEKALRGATRVLSGIELVLLTTLIGLFWLMIALMVVAVKNVRVTGNLFVDAVLVALVPAAVAFAVLRAVRFYRARAFGIENAAPPMGFRDALMTTAAATMGPLLLLWAVPPLVHGPRDKTMFVLALVGAYISWIPVSEIRRLLRERCDP
jgi:hypothetical protein